MFGNEQKLPMQGFISVATYRNYDISPDGQRFLMMNMKGPDGTRPKINVVLNWFEELKRLVPTGE